MNWTKLRRRSVGAVVLPVALLGSSVLIGCDALDVSDPTVIEERELSNPEGANMMRADALSRLYGAIGDASLHSALVSDELIAEWPTFWVNQGMLRGFGHQEGEFDRREPKVHDIHHSLYVRWQDARYAAALAIPALRNHLPVGAQPRVGEMFAARGFAALRLAEDYCPGFPLHDLAGFKPVYGAPLTTDQALEHALADFDSALVNAGDSVRIQNLARVARGRTLLALGRFADAAEAVASVPTSYIENARYNASLAGDFGPQTNRWAYYSTMTRITDQNWAVANREGRNGVDFVEAADPRLKLKFLRTSDRDGFDLHAPLKYPDFSAPIVLTSGIEARLIEAEAALKGGGGNWLAILNDLRATQITPAMMPLADPGNDAARVDLLFRERAFWLFGTGHRLADLRRLVARYGRPVDKVFPTGEYRLGGTYTNVTNMAFKAESELPFSAGSGCTDR